MCSDSHFVDVVHSLVIRIIPVIAEAFIEHDSNLDDAVALGQETA